MIYTQTVASDVKIDDETLFGRINLTPTHSGVLRPSRQMQKWTPALKASIMVLKLAAAVTRVVTGLPIPIGVDEMSEGMAFAVLAGA